MPGAKLDQPLSGATSKSISLQSLQGESRQIKTILDQTNSSLLAPSAQNVMSPNNSVGSAFPPAPYVSSIASTAASLMAQNLAFGLPLQEIPQEAMIEPIQHPGQQPSAESVLVGVIITISDGTSYDPLFSQVPQRAGENQRVATYRASVASLQHMINALSGNTPPVPLPTSLHRNLRRMAADIREVQPDSVVFNWECCAGCGNNQFHDASIVMNLVKHLLDRGHMVMFSDFSLKALITEWKENLLGPNPFLRVSEFEGTFQLRFDAATLRACSSAQLQKLGELASNGKADLHAMSNTIAFSIDWSKADCSAYNCQVLTVMSQMCGQQVETLAQGNTCEAGGHRGLAGHVLLTYPSGGRLLASAGHWIELSRLDVSEADLLQVAGSYGAAFQSEVLASMSSCRTNEERQRSVQLYSMQMIQQSPPCSIQRQSPPCSYSA
jgi:hypothetical protein